MTKNSISKDVNNAAGWEARINLICQRLRIPELQTRSGLRKIHKTFPDVYGRLSACYSENTKHHAVLGSIVTIYARMCYDSLLRDKLLREGFLSQIIPLLDVPLCRVPALKCMVTLTHHGGLKARQTLAKQTQKLVELAKNHMEDSVITEQCIVIIAHSATSILNTDEHDFDPKMYRSLGSLESVLKLVDVLLRQPTTSYNTFDHILSLLTGGTNHGRAAFLAHPSSVSFLAACLRSTDLQTRVSGLVGILRLHLSVAEHESRLFDIQKVVANLHRGRHPPIMSDALMRYGMERADITGILATMRDYQNAMMKCAQDNNLYALGMKLFELIGRTEFSIADGEFQDENGETMDLGLPFVRWLEALPLCAKAIREQGTPAQRDAANVVEIKYFICKSRHPDAHSLAEASLKNSPGVAFYYYALTLGATKVDGLRWAKKGLKCKGPSLTPYVRFGLLFCAIEHAGLLALEVLEEAKKGEKAWEEGFAILRCAFEDSKTYVAEAPPDTRYMSSAILWLTLLSVALRGADLSPDLSDLQPIFEKQKVADEIRTYIQGKPPARTQFRLARETVFKYYAPAATEWGDIVSKFDERVPISQALLPSRSADEELSTWLEGTHLDDEEGEGEKMECFRLSVNEKALELYRCSSCRNPSANLKKCAQCGKARYCDPACQKLHWPEHKKTCKASNAV